MSTRGTRRPPDGTLILEWVFGYNGHTARNNVKINAEGNLVYYVAGVGVVHDPKEQTQKFFTGHSDDITSLALNSEKRIAATGQVGDDAYIAIWNALTCQPLSVIHDAHSVKVSALGFSLDSSQLASVGGAEVKMELIVWDWQKGRRLGRQVAHAGKVEEVEFDPNNSAQLVTCGAKHVKFWKLRGNVLNATLGIFGEAPTEDQISVTFLGKDRLVSGSEGGDLLVWAGGRVTKVISNVHLGGVSTMESFKGGIITGGQNGTIRIFDEQLREIAAMNDTFSVVYNTPSPIQSLSSDGNTIVFGTRYNEIWMLQWGDEGSISGEVVVQGHAEGEVWALATHPTLPIALTGSDDGTIRLWSLSDFRQITSALIGEEVRSAAFHPSGDTLAIGLLHGSFIILESENLKTIKQISDRKEARNDIRYSPDGKLLAVASNDNFVDLYKVGKGYEKLKEIGGASSFITHLDWSANSKFLQTNSGAGERLIFKVDDKGMVDFLPKGLQWASWTCVLGNDVTGLWGKYTDLSDVNAVDANFTHNIIASGDDYGMVKIFRFPCPKRGSKPRASVGHSAHVTNVRWTSDSTRVLSLGGADHAVFVWRFKPTRNMTSAIDTVSARDVDEDSEEDVVDTEDELEAIPEITGDLEEEFANLKTGADRRRRHRTLSSGSRAIIKPEVRDDSVFAKRCKAVDEHLEEDLPPAHHLRIEHIFGYRSYDSRDNCHWLKDGGIVYHVAAVGIVCDPKTGQQRHYLHHNDDITCLAVHPDGELVVTGQVGYKSSIHVWSSTTMKILSYLGGGHDKGVAAVAFSFDGERVASIGADDYHTVVVWKWVTGRRIASVRNSAKKVFGLRFNPSNNSQLVTYGVRHIRVWSVVGSGMSWRQVTMGQKHKTDTVLCCAAVAGADGNKWALGMASGLVLVISQVEIEKHIKAHKGAIYSIFVPPEEDSKSAWTGGRDGLVCEWDRSFQRCLRSFPISDHSLIPDCPVSLSGSHSAIRSLSWHTDPSSPLLIGTENSEIIIMNSDGLISILVQGHCKGEVWGLSCHPRLQEAVTVSDDRTLRRWVVGDEFRPIGLAHLRKSARCVHFHPKGNELVVGFLDGSIGLFAYPSLERVGGAHNRQERIADVKFSPDGRLLAVASHDSFVDLYVVDSDGDVVSKKSAGLKRLGVCRDASSFISHITWHKDSRLLQINSGAGEQLFYEAPKGIRLLIPEKSEETLAWGAPLTCPLDVTLAGVWQPENDLSDINAVATSHNHQLVATASDEDGLLKLFKYPCKGKVKRHRRYAAHSSHVTKVWWTFDDKYLITCGGADSAVIVWSVLKGNVGDDSADQDERAGMASDLPEEDVTLVDLELSGLSDVSPLPPVMDSKRRTLEEAFTKEQRQKAEQLLVALQRLRALPVVWEDRGLSVFLLYENLIKCFDLKDGQVTDSKVAYDEHDTHVTAIAMSTNHVWFATASTGLKEVKNEQGGRKSPQENYVPGDQGALVHVWRTQDGGTVTTLTTGDSTNIVTCLSFSPNGRFLAVLGDASVIHIFNWVKGIRISEASLKTGGVVAITYSSDNTVAALTPKALYLCDMVGNALLPTRTLVPPGLLSDPTIVFTSLTVEEDKGHILVGCSDASVLKWSKRIAIQRSSNSKKTGAGKTEIINPKSTISKVRSVIATGSGTTYLAFRNGIELIVQLYSTEDLSYTSEHRTGVPHPTWRPTSISLGETNLVLGGLKGEPIVLLELKKFAFQVIKSENAIRKETKNGNYGSQRTKK